jgi:hypothetical protein
MAEIKDKVLEKIKENKIEPKPRWQILLKNDVIWSVFGFAVLIGAISFCVILDTISDNDWDIYRYATDSPLQRIILSLPFFWFGFLLIFWILAFYYYKQTKSGYRFSSLRILGLSIIASIFLGATFNFFFGLGEKVEVTLAERIPFYDIVNSHCNNKEVWMQPEKGLLAGSIVSITVPESFYLEDFNGASWRVDEGKNIFIKTKSPLTDNEEIKIIGEEESAGVFRALEIRIWKKGCAFSKAKKDKD